MGSENRNRKGDRLKNLTIDLLDAVDEIEVKLEEFERFKENLKKINLETKIEIDKLDSKIEKLAGHLMRITGEKIVINSNTNIDKIDNQEGELHVGDKK